MRRILFSCLVFLCLSGHAVSAQESADDFLNGERPSWKMPEATPEPKPDANVIPKQNIPLDLETKDGKAPGDIAAEEIPEVLLEEMEAIEKQCTNNAFYATYHDCRCISIKFLDARMKSAPHRSRDAIFESVSNECPNEPGIAGFVFRSCLDVMRYSRPDDFDKFCSCAANQVAAAYTERPRMNMRYIDNLRKTAFVTCGNRFPEPLYDELE